MSTQEEFDAQEYDLLVDDAGFAVEVKRPKDKTRQGSLIRDCAHCGFEGRAEIGRLPRPSTKPAEFCPACRGAV